MIANYAMPLLLAAMVVLAALGILRRSRSNDSHISLDGLLLTRAPDGKVVMDKPSAAMFTALGVSSWVIVFASIKGTLTDAMFGAYLLAWVAPLISVAFKKEPPPP